MSKSSYRHYYNMDNLNEDLVTESDTKYTLLCPYCMSHGEPSRKPTLYIYKDSKTGYCFRCKSFIYTEKSLLTNDNLNKLDRVFNNSLDSLLPSEITYDTVDISKLPRYEDDEELVNYIETKRSPCYHELLVKIGCKSFTKKIHTNNSTLEFKGILFPFIIDGSVVSYQIRYINTDKKFRYYTKPGEKYPFRLSDEFDSSKITICEGVFDVLGYSCLGFPTPIAILGSSISESVASVLKRYTSITEILVGMDDMKLNYELASSLKSIFPTSKIFLVKLSGGRDPDETFIYESTNHVKTIELVEYKSSIDYRFSEALSKIL